MAKFTSSKGNISRPGPAPDPAPKNGGMTNAGAHASLFPPARTNAINGSAMTAMKDKPSC